MRDYNFFTSFDKKKLTFDPKSPTSIIIAAVIVALVFCGGILITNLITNARLESANAALTEKKASTEYMKVQKTKDEMAALDQYNKMADQVIAKYDKASAFNSKFFTDFVKVIPQQVKLTSINLTGYLVAIQCSAQDRKAIAEFLSNMDQSGLFASVSLISVNAPTNEDAGVAKNMATIEALLKEGGAE